VSRSDSVNAIEPGSALDTTPETQRVGTLGEGVEPVASHRQPGRRLIGLDQRAESTGAGRLVVVPGLRRSAADATVVVDARTTWSRASSHVEAAPVTRDAKLRLS
jgi:hypothetical protein